MTQESDIIPEVKQAIEEWIAKYGTLSQEATATQAEQQ